MKKYFRGGSIVVVGKYHEEAIYDVLSNDLQVTFDGKGGIAEYSLCNQAGSLLRDCTMHVYINGEMLDVFSPKKVKLAGRTATVTLKTEQTEPLSLRFIIKTEE